MTYLETLTGSNYNDYMQKLRLQDGTSLPDPYSIPANMWVDDRKQWPHLEWPAIYHYLIDTPSVYTKESLEAYRSLDAVNYVLNGHVHPVKIYDTGRFCALRAGVLPSQRQGQKTQLYDAWVYVNRDRGSILTANCTCMSG